MAQPAELGKALAVDELLVIGAGEAFERREEITRHVAGAILDLSTAEAVAKLDAAGIWNAVVEDYDSLPANPQLQHLEAFRTVPGVTGAPITMVAHPVRYDGKPIGIARAPQALGAQTREILEETGFSSEEIDRLLSTGVVRGIEPAGDTA